MAGDKRGICMVDVTLELVGNRSIYSSLFPRQPSLMPLLPDEDGAHQSQEFMSPLHNSVSA